MNRIVSIVPFGDKYIQDFARLKTALKLHESIGFEYAPLPANTAYASADIYMELHIDKGRPVDVKHH